MVLMGLIEKIIRMISEITQYKVFNHRVKGRKMLVGDKVYHKDFPLIKGHIVAKTKRWGNETPVFLVKWQEGTQLSRHIGDALVKVAT